MYTRDTTSQSGLKLLHSIMSPWKDFTYFVFSGFFLNPVSGSNLCLPDQASFHHHHLLVDLLPEIRCLGAKRMTWRSGVYLIWHFLAYVCLTCWCPWRPLIHLLRPLHLDKVETSAHLLSATTAAKCRTATALTPSDRWRSISGEQHVSLTQTQRSTSEVGPELWNSSGDHTE